jgi:hypothetical protein
MNGSPKLQAVKSIDLDNPHSRMVTRYNIEVRNIHANSAYPGVLYAELYVDGQRTVAATLDHCIQAVYKYINQIEDACSEVKK